MANIRNPIRTLQTNMTKLKIAKSVHATIDGVEKCPMPGSTPSAKKPRKMKMFKHATNVPCMPALALSNTWPKIGLMVKMKIQMAKAMKGLKRLKSPISPVAGTHTREARMHEKMVPRTDSWK